MDTKILCPVCRVAFVQKTLVSAGSTVVCPVCGAKLEVLSAGPDVAVRRAPQEPPAEIQERIDNFARLRHFRFNEDRDMIMEGLLAKNAKFGDFYCPCKFDNVPENICPCLETRSGRVVKEGRCY